MDAVKDRRWLLYWGSAPAAGHFSLLEETNGRARYQTIKRWSAALPAPTPWSRAQGPREGAGSGGTLHAPSLCSLVSMTQEMSWSITKQISNSPHSGRGPRKVWQRRQADGELVPSPRGRVMCFLCQPCAYYFMGILRKQYSICTSPCI